MQAQPTRPTIEATSEELVWRALRLLGEGMYAGLDQWCRDNAVLRSADRAVRGFRRNATVGSSLDNPRDPVFLLQMMQRHGETRPYWGAFKITRDEYYTVLIARNKIAHMIGLDDCEAQQTVLAVRSFLRHIGEPALPQLSELDEMFEPS